MDEPLLSLGVRKILERTTTCDEILDSGTYGPNNDVCCSKFLICKPGGDKDFQCPGCKMPPALVEEAIRRNNEENPPATSGLTPVYANW